MSCTYLANVFIVNYKEALGSSELFMLITYIYKHSNKIVWPRFITRLSLEHLALYHLTFCHLFVVQSNYGNKCIWFKFLYPELIESKQQKRLKDISTQDFSKMNFSTLDFSNMNFWTMGLKSSSLKGLGLKDPGLKIEVEKSGVEMSFNPDFNHYIRLRDLTSTKWKY